MAQVIQNVLYHNVYITVNVHLRTHVHAKDVKKVIDDADLILKDYKVIYVGIITGLNVKVKVVSIYLDVYNNFKVFDLHIQDFPIYKVVFTRNDVVTPVVRHDLKVNTFAIDDEDYDDGYDVVVEVHAVKRKVYAEDNPNILQVFIKDVDDSV